MTGTKTTSVLDQIKARRAKLHESRTLDLNIPGYGGALVARYAPLPYDKFRSIQDRNEKTAMSDGEREVNVAIDTLMNACLGIFIREEGELRPLEHESYHVKYDGSLMQALDLNEPIDPRHTVKEVFPSDIAIMTQFTRFIEWQTGEDAAIDSSLVGESVGAS